jgi:hypothetical protein
MSSRLPVQAAAKAARPEGIDANRRQWSVASNSQRSPHRAHDPLPMLSQQSVNRLLRQSAEHHATSKNRCRSAPLNIATSPKDVTVQSSG